MKIASRKARLLLAMAISYLPSRLKPSLYGLFLGYSIDKQSKIGMGVLIAVDHFSSKKGLVIRRGTSFTGPISIGLDENVFIGRWNRFDCGDAAADAAQAHMNYRRTLEVGRNCLINEGHLFDVLGAITIGEGTWIAGFESQFLTHGAGVMDRDITFGRECFVGSAVRFAPGSGVGDRTIVAMGAIVTKNFDTCDVIVGGVPAKLIRQRSTEDGYEFKRTWQ